MQRSTRCKAGQHDLVNLRRRGEDGGLGRGVGFALRLKLLEVVLIGLPGWRVGLPSAATIKPSARRLSAKKICWSLRSITQPPDNMNPRWHQRPTRPAEEGSHDDEDKVGHDKESEEPENPLAVGTGGGWDCGRYKEWR